MEDVNVDNFIKAIDYYILQKFRQKGIISQDVEEYFQKFSERYKRDPALEFSKLFNCIGEEILNKNNEKKSLSTLRKYVIDIIPDCDINDLRDSFGFDLMKFKDLILVTYCQFINILLEVCSFKDYFPLDGITMESSEILKDFTN